MNLQDVISAADMDGSIIDLLVTIKDGVATCNVFDIQKVAMAYVEVPLLLPDMVIPIINVDNAIALLKRFSDNAKTYVKNNKLIVSEGGKRGWITLGDVSNIESHNDFMSRDNPIEKQEQMLKDYDYFKTTLRKDELTKLKGYTSVVDNKYLRFVLEDNTLKFRVEGEGIALEKDIGTVEGEHELSVTMANPLKNIVNTMFEEEVTLHLRTNSPLYIVGEHSKYIIAPIIEGG